ncbi:MAG: hypothetical protein BWZ10_03378 [candidate division BRC1 bacterium ADurb.BinA364]|nr:MAG: hypothetical protein BWZ10_03378 [candidate division BRC1 bacterium ADurb.BinA364]
MGGRRSEDIAAVKGVAYAVQGEFAVDDLMHARVLAQDKREQSVVRSDEQPSLAFGGQRAALAADSGVHHR